LVAQRIERLSSEQKVGGSIPSEGTNPSPLSGESMRACILSIGSEIMLGQITDTNASWLARDLADTGIELRMVMQVGDDSELLLDALRPATDLADLVICTGGIGPTDDDLTRETIAALVGESPEVDPALLEELEAFFAQSGRVMPRRNAKQAWTIPSATIL